MVLHNTGTLSVLFKLLTSFPHRCIASVRLRLSVRTLLHFFRVVRSCLVIVAVTTMTSQFKMRSKCTKRCDEFSADTLRRLFVVDRDVLASSFSTCWWCYIIRVHCQFCSSFLRRFLIDELRQYDSDWVFVSNCIFSGCSTLSCDSCSSKHDFTGQNEIQVY